MRPDLRRECAGEGRDGLVYLSPKEVAQVRILPGARLSAAAMPEGNRPNVALVALDDSFSLHVVLHGGTARIVPASRRRESVDDDCTLKLGHRAAADSELRRSPGWTDPELERRRWARGWGRPPCAWLGGGTNWPYPRRGRPQRPRESGQGSAPLTTRDAWRVCLLGWTSSVNFPRSRQVGVPQEAGLRHFRTGRVFRDAGSERRKRDRLVESALSRRSVGRSPTGTG
jgi:hypothetical protein